MPGVCEIIINLLVISSIVVETVNAATIAEEERKWFLRALDEEQRYIRRELLARYQLYTIGLPGKSILGGHFLGLPFRVELPDLVTSANFGSSRVGPSGPRHLCLHAT